jgi:tetratricopeptide (TPR) repeat protein
MKAWNTRKFLHYLIIILPILLAAGLQLQPRAAPLQQALHSLKTSNVDSSSTVTLVHLNQVVEIEPWRGETWEQIGSLQMKAGQIDPAVKAYEQAYHQGALSLEGQDDLIQLYQRQGNLAAAISLIRKQIETGETGAVTFDQVIRLQLASGDRNGALLTLQNWRQHQPESARVRYLQGVLMLQEDPQQAVSLLLEASQRDPNLAERVGKLRAAAKRLADEPDLADRMLVLGQAFSEVQEWRLALPFLEQAVQAQPENGEAWALLAEVQQQAGESGWGSMQQAVKLAPQSPTVQAFAALYWRRQGRPDIALTYLTALINRHPDQAAWHVEMGNTLAELGNLQFALDHYQTAVELEAANADHWRALALFCLRYNMDIEGVGVAAARQAVYLAPNQAAALDVMGLSLMALDDLENAERFLLRALEKDEKYSPALLHLGQLYLEKNDRELAYLYLLQAAHHAETDAASAGQAQRLLDQFFPGG